MFQHLRIALPVLLLSGCVNIVINFAQGNPSAVLTVNQSAGR